MIKLSFVLFHILYLINTTCLSDSFEILQKSYNFKNHLLNNKELDSEFLFDSINSISDIFYSCFRIKLQINENKICITFIKQFLLPIISTLIKNINEKNKDEIILTIPNLLFFINATGVKCSSLRTLNDKQK